METLPNYKRLLSKNGLPGTSKAIFQKLKLLKPERLGQGGYGPDGTMVPNPDGVAVFRISSDPKAFQEPWTDGKPTYNATGTAFSAIPVKIIRFTLAGRSV